MADFEDANPLPQARPLYGNAPVDAKPFSLVLAVPDGEGGWFGRIVGEDSPMPTSNPTLEGLFGAPALVVPPGQRMFLGSTTQSQTVIPVEPVDVNVPNSTPVQLKAGSTGEVWAFWSAELYFSQACTVTIGGFSIKIPGEGIYSLTDRKLAYGQTAAGSALNISVTAGTSDGVIYVGKGIL